MYLKLIRGVISTLKYIFFFLVPTIFFLAEILILSCDVDYSCYSRDESYLGVTIDQLTKLS
jgi:hypothetical protein